MSTIAERLLSDGTIRSIPSSLQGSHATFGSTGMPHFLSSHSGT